MVFYAQKPPEENSRRRTKSIGLEIPVYPGLASTLQDTTSVQTVVPASHEPRLPTLVQQHRLCRAPWGTESPCPLRQGDSGAVLNSVAVDADLASPA